MKLPPLRPSALRSALAIAFLAPGLGAGQARAATATADTGVVDLEPVTVTAAPQPPDQTFLKLDSTIGGKFPTPARDIPQQLEVLPKELLDTQAATTLYRALDNVPGIVVTPSADTATGNNINLRGFQARTDFYLDGIRDRGQYYRDTFDLERIEVLEGPASLLFGHGSTGGIINQVSKRAQLAPIGDLRMMLGTDNYYRSTIDYNQAIDPNSAFRLNLMGENIQATRSSTLEDQDYGIAPTLALGIGTDTRLDLSFLSQRNNDKVDYGFPLFQFAGQPTATPIVAPFDRLYQYRDSNIRTDVNITSADFQHTFSPNFQMRSNTQYGSYRVEQNSGSLNTVFSALNANGQYMSINPATIAAPPLTPLSSLTLASQEKQRIARDTTLFNQTDFNVKFVTGPISHDFLFGGEVGRDEFQQLNYNNYNFNLNNGAGLGLNLPGVINLDTTNNGYFPSDGPNVYTVPGNLTVLNASTRAGYLNDTASFGARKEYKLVAGVRLDHFDADQVYDLYNYNTVNTNAVAANTAAVQARNQAAIGSPTQQVLTFEHADRRYSPRAGLIWQPTENQSYYAMYGTSFDPQAFEGTASTGTLPTTIAQLNSFIQGGGLKPEETRTFEVGAKYDLLAHRLNLTGALFDTSKYNTRFTDPVTGNIGVNGDTRIEGADLKMVGRLAPGWQLLLAYTYLDGRIVSSPIPFAVGKTPPEVSKHSGVLWTTYDLPQGMFAATGGALGGHWQIGGGAKALSQQFIFNSGYNLFGSAPGYVRYDAEAAYLAHRWDLRVNLENLTNRHYYFAANAGRAVPGDGFRAILTGTYHFLAP